MAGLLGRLGPNTAEESGTPLIGLADNMDARVGERAAHDVERAMQELSHVERLRQSLDNREGDLWAVHPVARNAALDQALHAPASAKIITVASLKGGVGKTTIVSNMAACLARAGQRVLLIDLDEQAALTKTLARASGMAAPPQDLASAIVAGAADPAMAMQGAALIDDVLPRARLIGSSALLGPGGQREFVRWLLEPGAGDLRFRLAEILSDRQVRGAFDVIVIDTAATLTPATVNALAASTHVVVPAILDGLSVDPVRAFLATLCGWVQSDLNPGLALAGIVGTKTSAQLLSPSEQAAAAELDAAVADVLGVSGVVCTATVPQRNVIAKMAGRGIAYQADTGRNSVQDIFDRLTHELVQRIASGTAVAA